MGWWGALRLGKILGVDVYLNPFFLALLGLFFVAGVLAKGLLAFACVLAHELAHVLAARRLGLAVEEVELLPFGGVARLGGQLVLHPAREFWVALAGPLGNLLLVFLALGAKRHGLWHEELGPFFIQCNLLLAAFNLLPALPLDGGRVYRAVLAGRLDLRQATYRASALGQALALVVLACGVVGLWLGASGLDVIFVALFLFFAARRERARAPFLVAWQLAAKKGELLRGGMLPAAQLVALEEVPLGQVVASFLPRRFSLVLVLDRHWRVKGLFTEAQLIENLLKYGTDLPVGRLPTGPD